MDFTHLFIPALKKMLSKKGLLAELANVYILRQAKINRSATTNLPFHVDFED